MLYSENLHFDKKGIRFTDKHGNILSINEASEKIFNRIKSWFKDISLFFLHFVSLHVPFWSLRKLVFTSFGVKIGKGSTIHMGCRFFEPAKVSIGNDTIVGDSAFLDGRANLVIGSHVDLASEVMIYNSEHNINSPTFEAEDAEVEIGDFVFVGPRAIILPGAKIGKGAVVAAGAVVTKDVPEFEIVGGVPALKIGERKLKELNYRLGRARLFQ